MKIVVIILHVNVSVRASKDDTVKSAKIAYLLKFILILKYPCVTA